MLDFRFTKPLHVKVVRESEGIEFEFGIAESEGIENSVSATQPAVFLGEFKKGADKKERTWKRRRLRTTWSLLLLSWFSGGVFVCLVSCLVVSRDFVCSGRD